MTIDLKAIRAAAEFTKNNTSGLFSVVETDALIALLDRLEAAEKDAARYRWLKANHQAWSWQPSRYSSEIISGFACNNTGYLGFAFEESIDTAMKEQK